MKHAADSDFTKDNFDIDLSKVHSSHKEKMKNSLSPDVEKSDQKIPQEIVYDNSNIENIFIDISQWPKQMTKYVDYWIRAKSTHIQNNDSKILDLESYVQKDGETMRKCKTSMFERKVKNGESVKRSWLCFSPITGKLYCFYCKLFSKTKTQFTHEGYCDWKNAHNRLQEHEKSQSHLQAIYDFTLRSSKIGVININLKKQAEDEKNYWKTLLKRIISVIMFLVERNLPLRGDHEILGTPNNGNFLGLIELLALYDDFLKAHLLKYAQRGAGNVSYLSPKICEELIEIISNQLLNKIIENIKESRYYSISVDSTTDVGHTDQLCLTIRYLENNEPIERFLTFMSNKGHKAQNIFDALISFLKKYDIKIENCRGQSYDNASVMSGEYNGLQALIKRKNQLALWIPCFGHSLNLVGTATMTCCLETKQFFDFLENLYVFFTISSERHDLLAQKLMQSVSGSKDRLIIPKRVSTTRWSSRAEAVKSVCLGIKEYRTALLELAEDNDEARGLYNIIIKLETNIYIVFWNDILKRINLTSLKLQSCNSDLNTSIALLKSLKSFIESLRDNFEKYEVLGKEKSGCDTYKQKKKRVRKQNVRLNPLDYGQTEAVKLTNSQNFRIECYIPVIDQLTVSLNQRINAYETSESYFGFLRRLNSLSLQEIREHVLNLIQLYKDDLEENLIIELVQFKEFIKNFIVSRKDENEQNKMCVEAKMYNFIMENNLQDVFPNTCVLLKIYLVLMTTNCTSERSFSKLKLIKSRLRSSMKQDRLNNLTIMSTERDLLRSISYSNIIDDFAENKSRKVLI